MILQEPKNRSECSPGKVAVGNTKFDPGISMIVEKIQMILECHERDSHDIMENILILLQNIPLSSNEYHAIDEICLQYMKSHNITQNDEIYQLYLKRMSFTFLPGVTQLNIRPKLVNDALSPISMATTIETPEGIDVSEERIPKNESFSESESLLLAMNYAPSGYRFTCTMRRRKTALQTSYRLDIDGCTSLSNGEITLVRSDSLTNIDPLLSLQLAFKGFVLCAKKQNRNLGLSSSYQIWGPCGWKEWKEKSAIGKISRNNGIYIGIFSEFGQECLLSLPPQYLPFLPSNKRCIAVKVLSGGLDKLLHLVAAVQLEPLETTENEIILKNSPRNSVTESPPAQTAISPQLESEGDMELILPGIVESICASKASSSQLVQPLPSGTLLLQSRRPKKLKSNEMLSSSYYTIQYGENGRVKNPSRKNIVMERMKYDPATLTVDNNIFHSNGDHPLEPEWMSSESTSCTPRANGNGYSPTIDLPVLQVLHILYFSQ